MSVDESITVTTADNADNADIESTQRREVEPGIYVRLDTDGNDLRDGGETVFEITWNIRGEERWHVVNGSLQDAKRALSNRQPRRKLVERGICLRLGADGEVVLKNGKQVYEIGWRDTQGKQHWRVVSGGITAAKSALAQQHAARSRGERVASDPRMTFNAAADAWWEARIVKLRPQTQATYASALKHLRTEFGRRRLTDITAADVARFISAQQRVQRGTRTRANGEKIAVIGYRGWTVKGHLTALSGVFRYAGRHLAFTGVNPVTQLDHVERPSLDDERPKRVLGEDELGRLTEAVDEPYRLIFEFAAETGGRLSEVLGIVWGEIDLEDAKVSFTHQLSHGKRVPLKTKRSQRSIEITPSLAAKLREYKMASGHSGDHDFCFVTRRGTAHDQRNVGGRVLARAVKHAGLEAVERDGQIIEYAPTFHNLRHSHGSALIAAGWDIEEVSARLGHADVSITLKTYVHEYQAAKRSDDRRNRLAALYGGNVEASVEAAGSSKTKQTSTALNENVLQMPKISDVAK